MSRWLLLGLLASGQGCDSATGTPPTGSTSPELPTTPPTWTVPPTGDCAAVDLAALPEADHAVTIDLVEPVAGSRAQQVWLLEVTAPVEVSAVVTLDDGAGHHRVLRPRGTGTSFRAPVVGFRPDRSYTVEVQLVDPDGTERIGAPSSFSVAVPPLHPDLPDLEARVDDAVGRPDVLFPAHSWPDAFWLVRVDDEGHVVWYLDADFAPLDVREREDGRLMFDHGGSVVITDWADEEPLVVAPPDPLRDYHHEQYERPGGGFFTLAYQIRQVDDLPVSYAAACEPGEPSDLLDVVVVEVDETLQVVARWSMVDRLDSHRIGWGGLDLDAGIPDWGHGNAVVHVPEDDSLIVSLRSQDATLKLDRQTGEIRWILANPEGWPADLDALRLQPVDPAFRWLFHSHAPEPLDDRILLFDNGNAQGTPCGGPNGNAVFSRVVELRIDEAAGTVEQVWAWNEGLFAPVMGDADRIGEGRVLVTYGQLFDDENGSLARQGLGDRAARVFELDPATGEVPWQLRITSDRTHRPTGWSAPRAQAVGCP